MGLTSLVDNLRKRAKRKLLCNKNLPADLKNACTMGLTSLVDDPRKRTKRKLLCNKNLPTDLKNARTMGTHVARRRPEKTREDETAAQ
ncbi:hypothetical protein PanWU01x14_304330 [Parasponia andersonii]|uniref:Uncharacterized protein n=1 Tax=Parasponia andersonii TaxID=3476 RepID=A0A2P5ASM6_PARAD|nr:hypothetical protein PanWU01x14_304330 [Parasponia andersonii]